MKSKNIIITLSFLISGSLYAQDNPGDLHPKDSIFFEYNTIPYQIDTSQPGNCWQVGHPSKTFFNQSYSLPLAIVTDTLLPYPVNTQSSFSFIIADSTALFGQPPCGGATYVQFNHEYETDTLLDYGYVEYSFDHGLTWYVAKDTTIQNGPWGMMSFYWQDDYTPNSGTYTFHPVYISGHSDGWIVSRFIWQWFWPEKDLITQFPDTIVVRFSFHSDNIQTNKEGWMIDNIITGCMELGSAVPNHQVTDLNYISPNPLTTVAHLQCPGEGSNSLFNIYDLTGRLVFQDHLDQNGTLELKRQDFYPGIFIWIIKTKDITVATGKLVVQ